MIDRRHLQKSPFVIAISVAVVVVLSAPVVGQFRAWIRMAFPGRFVLVVGGIGTLILLPLILVYTGYVYWLFRGKVTSAHGYH